MLPVGLALALAAAPLLPGAMARADDRDARVNGQAQATFARLVPFLGVPGVNTSLGTTTAQVGSGTAQASAAAADFGLVGTIVNANAGDGSSKQPTLQLPEPVDADSEGTQHVDKDPFAAPGAPAAPTGPGAATPAGTAPAASTGPALAAPAGPTPAAPAGPAPAALGTTTPVGPAPAASGAPAPNLGGAHETADATRAPLAATGTATGPDLSVPGVVEVVGGLSRSAVEAASATAHVTIGQISLGGGQVLLSNLSWNAGQHLGAAGVPAFTLGGMTVAGKPLPVAAPDQLAAAIAAANQALDPLGLALLAPSADAGDGAAVGPLVVQFRNPQSLVGPTAQVGAALTPPMAQLTKAIIAAYPDSSAAQIVVNAALGAAGGRSGGRLELGGVSARSVLAPLDATAIGPTTAPPLPPSIPIPPAAAPPAAPVATTPTVPNSPAAAAPPTVNVALNNEAPHPVSYAVAHHSRRTLTATLLGVGLLIVLLMAAGDRIRAMR
jgi:hypothetical protein